MSTPALVRIRAHRHDLRLSGAFGFVSVAAVLVAVLAVFLMVAAGSDATGSSTGRCTTALVTTTGVGGDPRVELARDAISFCS